MVEQRKTVEYNGWKGNGDSLVSARLTWLTALWLSNEPALDQQTRHIANADVDVREAGETLKRWVEEVVMSQLLDQSGLATGILRSILQHEINWSEIVLSVRDRAGDEGIESSA